MFFLALSVPVDSSFFTTESVITESSLQHISCSSCNNRRGMNSPSQISSPLKWTETFIKSYKNDFTNKVAISIEGRTVENGASYQFQPKPLSVDSLVAKPMDRIPAVSQLSDVRSTDWTFRSLQSLVQRYSDKKLLETQNMTRYEFAIVLDEFLTSIQQQRKTQKITREDLAIIKRLQSEFDAELGILTQQTNSLESRLADLESRQFSTTTTLTGEAIFAISDDFGDGTNDNLVFQYRTQLGLRTSFTGEDLLRMSLRSGNAGQFSYIDNLTNEGRLGFDGDTENQLGLSRISYEFPIGDRINVFIAPVGDDVNASNPFFRDRGTGSISRFGRQNPIYRLVESGGIGFEYEFSDDLELSLGYYNNEAEDSEAGDGLFNGNYSASAKLEFEPDEKFLLALLYVHSYNDTNLATGTGSIRSQLDLDRPIVGNSYSLETSWQLHPNFAIGGWVGFTDATILNLGEADVWNYALTLAFPGVGGEGNLLGVIIGQEPKLTSTSGFLIDGKTSDPDSSLHLEAFYRYQIRDNISITPGLIWITAPDHNNDNGDLVVLTVRTTFDF
jgi:hypothetical protein